MSTLINCIITFTVLISINILPGKAFALECINTKFLFDIKPDADQPSDLAVAPNGDIYIVDGVNNRIDVVDGNGGWKFDFGTEGVEKGQFNRPLGIDISDSGSVFIADTGNHRIQVFDLKGNFLNMFAVKTGSAQTKSDPVDVAASKIKNYLYVSDNDNHKIRVYSQNGAFEFEWGKFGEESGEFRYPGIMTINQFNEALVVDVLNTRVQKFDPFGKYISTIGAWGVLPGRFFRPKGVAVDKQNRVFISDSYMGVIQVFTDLGRFLGVVCENNEKKVFNTPVGLVIDKNNRLLVVEMRSNKVTVVKILE
ncbi:MAG: NHL repeat-containing protein [Nitrospirae bacterium]|nr:NHL repeat-containing protein [Nitrospirota bacterium]